MEPPEPSKPDQPSSPVASLKLLALEVAQSQFPEFDFGKLNEDIKAFHEAVKYADETLEVDIVRVQSMRDQFDSWMSSLSEALGDIAEVDPDYAELDAVLDAGDQLIVDLATLQGELQQTLDWITQHGGSLYENCYAAYDKLIGNITVMIETAGAQLEKQRKIRNAG